MLEQGARLLLVGVAIAANNMGVALCLGALGHGRHTARILTVFAGFEFTVPFLGVWLGYHAASVIAGAAMWLGPALLAAMGIVAIFSGTRDDAVQRNLADVLTGWRGLVMLSAGLSVDNLVVGFSLGLGGAPPFALAVTIMVCSVSFTYVGLRVGHRVHRRFHALSEIAGGVLLIALAGWSLMAD
jgi:putative Mn2+ efflux pump MntP